MVAPSLQITSLTNIFNLLLIVLPMFSTVAALRSKLYLPNCRIRFSVHRPVRQRNVASISNRLYLKSRDSKAFCCRKEYSSSGVISINRGGSQANVSTIDKATRECVFDEYYRVYIAVGANVGDRFNNLMKGISMMRDTTREDIPSSKSPSEENENDTPLIRIIGTSFLRETPPMYVTDQPSFLNGAVEIETRLSPHALLRRLKDVEIQIGRDLDGMRYGPRPIDLDIIYYGVDMSKKTQDSNNHVGGGIVIESEILQVPHPRMSERDFVLAPLCDLEKEVLHPSIKISAKDLLDSLNDSINSLDEDNQPVATQVLPLPRGRMLCFNETHIMGILNVTPDSFSDGGNYKGSIEIAVEQALKMEIDGASIIDIGGESTRPGAKEVEIDVELERTIPVIRKIREVSDVIISIDTRHAEVAKAAIEAGADIVNDVSGGTHDSLMFETVGKLQVPMVIMHMRGNPETMQSMTQYECVVKEVSSSLLEQSKKAEEAGIPRWLQVLDPGIGFAKDLEHNLSLLKNSHQMRELVKECPLLLGPSRKGFIGKITGETKAEERDFGSLAACLAGLQSKDGKIAPTILRVHNVRGIKQGVQIFESILNANE